MRLVRLVAAVGLMVLVAGQPAVAFAAPDRIELSVDGERYSASLPQPLFADLGPLVPLDDEVRSFWVRNSSTVPARVSLEVLPSGLDSDLLEHLEVSTAIDGESHRRGIAQLAGGRCTVVLTGPNVSPGGTERVDVGLHLPDLPGQVGQDSSVNLGMTVYLSQVNRRGIVRVCGVQAAAGPVDPCLVVPVLGAGGSNGCVAGVDEGGVPERDAEDGQVAPVAHGGADADRASTGGGLLPGTGASSGRLDLVLTAVGLMGLGVLLLVVDRRRRGS